MAAKYTVTVDGQEISRAAYCRQLFNEGMSRGDIAKKLEMSYTQVYTATANMENAHHKPGTRTVGGSSVMVTLEDGTEMARPDYIRMLAKQGVSRGDIARQLEIPYSTVWAATKSLNLSGEGAVGGKVMITLEDGSEIARVDLIRQLFAEGKTRREIANAVGCDYAIVWAATKEKKVAEEPAPEVEAEAPVEAPVEAAPGEEALPE